MVYAWFFRISCDSGVSLIEASSNVKLFSLAHGRILWAGIWSARNHTIFVDVMPDWDSVFELILHRFSLWLNSAERNFYWTIMAYRFA
jgi:hypothetical protein